MGINSNIPISRPIDLGLETHVDMGGFAFNVKEGIFIPVSETDPEFTPPYWRPSDG